MGDLVLLDFSWVYHKAFHTFRNFSWQMGGRMVMTGPMYGTLRDIAAIRDAFHAPIYVAIEPEENSARYSINPEYKGGRPERDPGMFVVHDDTLAAIELFTDVKIFSSEDSGEADDVLQSLILENADKYDRFIVYANDNDLLQVAADPPIRGRVFFLDLKTKELTSFVDYCYNKYGVDPTQILVYRAIVGDSSDNLDGVCPRFPRELARKIAVGMPFNPTKTQEKYIKLLEANHKKFDDNLAIMSHRKVEVRVVQCGMVKKGIDYFVKNFGMKSLRKMIPEDV